MLYQYLQREEHTVLGDGHIDAFLIGLPKTPGMSACSGELFSGSDTGMMDAKADSEDKKQTKRLSSR